ncbi:c-type cytochrome [Singulisphaera sp. PoT]|uniref:c-type cytochrome n=1 Tax=Singulisphaera sp. PoT TaxID=3411797 RepID=UPI003BF5CD09
MPTRPLPLCRHTSAYLLALACLCNVGSFAAELRAEDAPTEKAANEANKPVTFNKDIAPLVFERCATCHRPGEVAPFPLLTYRDASKRAELIKMVIEDRTMPPWKAEPGSGHFADSRRLSDEQVALIGKWVKDGAPEGNPADLPATPKFATGWQLGEPDMVLKMAEAYNFKAEGDDEYRCFVIPLEIPAGKFIESVEYRPGNRKIVHHAVLTMLPKPVAEAKLKEGDGKSFLSGLAPPGQLLPGPLAFWTPGMVPRPLPSDLAAEWPQGVSLVLQLHLHPSGKEELEQSSIGLHFTDQKPKSRLEFIIMNDEGIRIKPGDKEYVVTKSITLPIGLKMFGVFPHMHLIGRTVKMTATLPDGSTKPLITINDWDFNWQNYYEYAEPFHLPAGTKIEGRWTYDNSSDNPANPSQPPKAVTYGEQTTDEMAITIFDALLDGPLPRRQGRSRAMGGPGQPRKPAQPTNDPAKDKPGL